MGCIDDKIEQTVKVLQQQRAQQEHARERFQVLAKAGWTVDDGSASLDIDGTSVIVREADGQLQLATGVTKGYCAIKDEHVAIEVAKKLKERLFAEGWEQG